jgi:peroxiredoxin
MRFIALLLFIISVYTGLGQTPSETNFSIAVINHSQQTIYYSYKDFQDSVGARQTRKISRVIKKTEIPFLFFIYMKDTASASGMFSRNFRIFLNKVDGRQIIVSESGKVNFISEKSEKLYDQYSLRRTKSNFWNLTDSIINSNRNDIASSEIIGVYLCRSSFSTDTIRHYYNMLSEKIKKSKSGQFISNYIGGRKSLIEGHLVKDFALKDSSMNFVSLLDIKSEYILLDFWFSSCKPCIESFPSLIELYNRTNRKKFDIIALSVDSESQINNWKKAIKKHNLPWINLLDPDYKVSFYTFSIESYPTKILLDQNRKIIKINPDNTEIEDILNGK